MKPNKLAILFALMTIVTASLACGGSVTTAHVAESWMASDIEGKNHTTVFSPESDFFAFIDLQNAPTETQLKAVWTAVSVDGEEPNLVVNETEFTSGSQVVYFQLFNDQLWPDGTYKVEIYINGNLSTTMSFEVQS